MLGMWKLLNSFVQPAQCSELPPPPGSSTDTAESATEDEANKAEPIIFDESESPLLAQMAQKYPLRPPSFEALLHPLRMISHIEPNDGLKCEVGMGLSQRIQLTNTWALPHAAPGNYQVTCLFAGGKMDNPFDPAGPNPLMMSRYDPTSGRQDIRFIYKALEHMEARLNAHYLTNDMKDSQIHFEGEYQGNDYVAGAKMGIGLDMLAVNYTQTLTKNWVAGFELMNMIKPRKICGMSYGLKYATPKATFFGQYVNFQEQLTLGAMIPGNNYITFSTQLDYSTMSGDTDLMVGMQVRFQRAKFNAFINGTGKMMTCLQHAVNPITRITLTGEMDLVKQEQKVGLSLNLGAS